MFRTFNQTSTSPTFKLLLRRYFITIKDTSLNAIKNTKESSSNKNNIKKPTVYEDSTSNNVYNKVGFIGAGKMAQAMLVPLVNKSLQSPSSISVYDVNPPDFSNHGGELRDVIVTASLRECLEDADLIVMAVKPQNCDIVFRQMNETRLSFEKATLLSIVAGKPIESFTSSINSLEKVARSMPNTPATIGQGMTVWSCTPKVCNIEKDHIKEVLNCFGKTVFVDDEKFIDMSTAISGSGPAYVFLLMESMIDAGVHMGFSREVATTLVHHTLLGSTLYAMETKDHPAILRNSVTSPAGTTASALYELENGRFRTVIKDAIWACYRRSLEMGGGDSNVGPGRRGNVVVQLEMPITPPKGEAILNKPEDN